MDLETLRALVEIFKNIGADTKEIVTLVLIYYSGKFVIGMGVVVFGIASAAKLIRLAITNTTVVGRLCTMDNIPPYTNEREKTERILEIFKAGLQVRGVHLDG